MKFTVVCSDKKTSYDAFEGETILQALRRLGIEGLHTPCGGCGWCKKCLVHLDDCREPVLACQTPISEGMTVLLNSTKYEVMKTGRSIETVPDVKDGLGIAVDIGTTTIVCQLVNLGTGEKLASCGILNPQVSYGADVLSRISASKENLSQLHNMVIKAISNCVDKLLKKTDNVIEKIHFAAIAGNTIMCCLLLEISPEPIGVYPFEINEHFGKIYTSLSMGFEFDIPVYVLPAVTGYIGGDVTGGILASGLHMSSDTEFFMDIGTNGEMALSIDGRLVCCATAAGPALEGAQLECGMAATDGAISKVYLSHGKVETKVIGDIKAEGICGSGIIDALALLLNIGAVNKSGQLEMTDDSREFAEHFSDDGTRFYLTDKVYISQRDIRELQLAKAAIAAGFDTCLHGCGITPDRIEKLKIAGGFGSNIDPRSCATIGLFPKNLVSATEFMGNTALEGAVLALLSADMRKKLEHISKQAEYIELGTSEYFQKKYIEKMKF